MGPPFFPTAPAIPARSRCFPSNAPYGTLGALVPPFGCGVNTVDPAGMTGGTGGCAVFVGAISGNAGAGDEG